MVSVSYKYIMGFLKDHGLPARGYYNNIIYLMMLLLGSLVLGALNQTVTVDSPVGEEDVAAYTRCALVGASNKSLDLVTDEDATECVRFKAESDAENQNMQLFNIAAAVVVINVLAFIWSVAAHWDDFIGLHQKLQWVVSAVNLGLFAGLVGWFVAQDGLNEADNIEYNVFFGQYNPYAVAVTGLVFGVLDLVLFNVLNMLVFKGDCTYNK